MSLRKKRRVIWCIFGLTFLFMLALILSPPDGMLPFTVLSILSAIASLALHAAWMRSPECGAYLGRDQGTYCKNCGVKLDWDAAKRKE